MVGGLAWILLAFLLAQSTRQNPAPIVRENVRWAANWNLTAVIVIGMLFAASFGAASESFTLGIPELFTPGIVGMGAVCVAILAHLVVTIIGMVKAGSQVYHLRLAIPFF